MHVVDYDLYVEYSANAINDKAINLLSRNRPVALVANASTFLGSHVVDFLLEKNIQVIGIDDLTISDKHNLAEASKNKDFHLINLPIESEEILTVVKEIKIFKLDYAFFITDPNTPDSNVTLGIINFIRLAKIIREDEKENEEKSKQEIKHGSKPRLVLVSSINLYGNELDKRDRVLKEAEIKFARGIKQLKLNGRIVRLSEVFGPRMGFSPQSPLSRLIVACLKDKLEDEKLSLNFTERSLFVSDAVRLLIKSVLSGSTSGKIYDGSLLHPVKLSEIRQILADPVWNESHHPHITKLPAWPTPNLLKTIKELSWEPQTPVLKALRETAAYFKEYPNLLPQEIEKKPLAQVGKNWSFEGSGFLSEGGEEDKKSKDKKDEAEKEKEFDRQFRKEKRNSAEGKSKKFFWRMVLIGLIIYGLFWPFLYLGYQGFSFKNHLLASKISLEQGNFSQSETEIKQAQANLQAVQDAYQSFRVIKKIPGIAKRASDLEILLNLAREGVDGILYATQGSKSLFETTKIISGESREEPLIFYEQAQRDLGNSSTKLSKVYASLESPDFKNKFPEYLGPRIDDLAVKINYYLNLVDQTKSAANLMPKLTGIGGKKSYLVLLQNNLELRPGGGFIGSYAKLDFDNGRLTKIFVDDVYNLDGQLKEVIAPTAELKGDLGQDRLYLRDSNYEPDFPTNAKLASFFYKKEAGGPLHGVISMDLKASGNLLDAVSGLDLPEYGEFVNGANLFERAITHAEANFFPGSQAKKNYLTSLQNQLFNKIFYLSKQNWPAIIQAIGKSLQEKHILVYLEDPELFSYLASSNWSGVFPRGSENREGETNDFLAVIESNMGANKANYFLQRKYNLDVSFTKEGKILNQLKINYKNTSPSEVFPAGIYKNRLKVYLPLGAKITKASFGETDITSRFVPFNDYGRSGFSTLIEIFPKEQKILSLEYMLPVPLSFKDNQAIYKLEVFKQAGTMQDPLDFKLLYPINFKLEEKPNQGSIGVQEIKIATDLQSDRVFMFKVRK